MTMTLTLGWWLVPAAITLGVLVWGFWPEERTAYGMDIGGAFQLLVGIIVVLASWLIWSLVA
jgi:hypothetical protein